jgi:hypothetical protein
MIKDRIKETQTQKQRQTKEPTLKIEYIQSCQPLWGEKKLYIHTFILRTLNILI